MLDLGDSQAAYDVPLRAGVIRRLCEHASRPRRLGIIAFFTNGWYQTIGGSGAWLCYDSSPQLACTAVEAGMGLLRTPTDIASAASRPGAAGCGLTLTGLAAAAGRCLRPVAATPIGAWPTTVRRCCARSWRPGHETTTAELAGAARLQHDRRGRPVTRRTRRTRAPLDRDDCPSPARAHAGRALFPARTRTWSPIWRRLAEVTGLRRSNGTDAPAIGCEASNDGDPAVPLSLCLMRSGAPARGPRSGCPSRADAGREQARLYTRSSEPTRCAEPDQFLSDPGGPARGMAGRWISPARSAMWDFHDAALYRVRGDVAGRPDRWRRPASRRRNLAGWSVDDATYVHGPGARIHPLISPALPGG